MLIVSNINKIFYEDFFYRKRSFSLKNISFKVKKGSISSFCGPNGSGKTSTFRIIMGLAFQDSGKVLWDGRHLGAYDKQKASYMPERILLYETLTPFEYLYYSSKYLGLNQSDADLKKIILDSLDASLVCRSMIHKKIGILSKGTRKKIVWAELSLSGSELFVLDEPFSDLDIEARERFKSWILDLSFKGKSFLVCSHNIDAFLPECDQRLLIQNGELI